MGYAIAAAATCLGAETTLITGPTALTLPDGVTVVRIESTAELHAAVKERFGSCDCLIMAAAPSDYRPAHVADHKLKRSVGLQLELQPTVDILKDLAPHRRQEQMVIGFHQQTDNGIGNAKRTLREKQLDQIGSAHV